MNVTFRALGDLKVILVIMCVVQEGCILRNRVVGWGSLYFDRTPLSPLWTLTWSDMNFPHRQKLLLQSCDK